MNDRHRNQPQPYDAVLGGQDRVPAGGFVLGGLDGVKRRLQTDVIDLRVAALREALQHGQRGLDLVIRALRDESEQVQWAAYDILREQPEPRVKLALELFSTNRVNYTPLKELLEKKQWRGADRMTKDLMLKASGITPQRHLMYQLKDHHIKEFPCEDLGIIDRLWLKYSNGRFGFSVQQPIWQKCDDSRWDKGAAWSLFGDRVGWRTYDLLRTSLRWKRFHELDFTLNAPIGHLPWLFGIFTVEAICDRFAACDRR
ncbi:GUN4 domain-containing protein [Pseudanabaena sp. PCC 6802]|uniref:GUN4 domain-containing protein n=1 Tax=Pseudanabaena sp. PCC 6802 TaxID=118173 RepID=UPI00034AD036|nr:GUN4 domain-containing protein [Pseudanabaena sp. PCC 6802]